MFYNPFLDYQQSLTTEAEPFCQPMPQENILDGESIDCILADWDASHYSEQKQICVLDEVWGGCSDLHLNIDQDFKLILNNEQMTEDPQTPS